MVAVTHYAATAPDVPRRGDVMIIVFFFGFFGGLGLGVWSPFAIMAEELTRRTRVKARQNSIGRYRTTREPK
jgi:hypothetical protein